MQLLFYLRFLLLLSLELFHICNQFPDVFFYLFLGSNHFSKVIAILYPLCEVLLLILEFL